MALPTLEQYNEAVQNPVYAFFDPELQHGKVRTSGLGLPLAACGGFALTYTITSGSGKYAVRCFHKEAKDREIRYAAISNKLSAINSSYFVGFKFQKNGIKVKGQPYPIVKMAWANGETIGEFVNSNFRKRDALLALKQSIQNLSLFLEKNRISHGDIQPGNVMVADGGKSIQLIDYDGMYLPEIGNLTSEEIGHRNFQHPDRARINPWNERTDRFSFILLSIVLDALILDPQLWIKSKSDGDKFLIGANDFVSPDSSKILSELSTIPSLKDNIRRFSSICCGDYYAIPSLTDYLNTAFQIRIATPSTARKVGYISTYPVLDAKNYDLCLQHVGDMVELVGKVVDVHFGTTKWGKPYFFLNFADWRGNAVKISVWSNYLDKAKGIDFKIFKDKFISVIGLMQPPYHGKSKHVEYNHLSIFLDTTVNEIDEHEVVYRLNYEKGNISPRETNIGKIKAENQNRNNSDIFNDIRNNGRSSANGDTSFHKTGSTSYSANQNTKTNRDIFNDIKNDTTYKQPSLSNFISSRPPHKHNAVIRCPKCSKINVIGVTGVETITCTACKCIFEYSHYTQKTHIISASPNMSDTKSGVNISCPYCHAINNVGTSGVLTMKCQTCNREFEYSHYTKVTKMLGKSTFRQGNDDILQQIREANRQSPQQTEQEIDKSGWGWIALLIGFILIMYLLSK